MAAPTSCGSAAAAGASPSAASSARACGAGSRPSSPSAGRSSSDRPANATSTSDSTPRTRSTVASPAAAAACSSSALLPIPGSPRSTSTPLAPARASTTNLSMRSRSGSRPNSMGRSYARSEQRWLPFVAGRVDVDVGSPIAPAELVDDRRAHVRGDRPVRRHLGEGGQDEVEPVRGRPAELLGSPARRHCASMSARPASSSSLDHSTSSQPAASSRAATRSTTRSCSGRSSALRSGGDRWTTISHRVGGESSGRSRHASRAGRRRPRASRSASSGDSGGTSGIDPWTA